MNWRLMTVAVALHLNGCFMLATAVHCSDKPPRDSDCEQLEEAAQEADLAILDAVTSGGSEVLEAVQLRGRITEEGEALARVAVRLVLEGDILAVVRTEGGGEYRLQMMVEAGECGALRVHAEDLRGRVSGPVAIDCVTQVLDYDFGSAIWSAR